MSNSNITDNKNYLTKTCSILLTVIFFILSFLTGFNNITLFVLGILILGLTIVLTYRSYKEFNYYALGVVLIPVLSYGIIMSLSFFTNSYYSITTKIFLVLNLLIFVISGYLSRKIEGFDFKWIIRGIFLSLSIICLINLIFTSVYFGPFYGMKIGDYYSYYDGAASRLVVGNTAYALCGYQVNQVPIEYYLLYPLLLLSNIIFYLLGDRKDKFNIITCCCFTIIALISIVFVISKVTLIFVLIYLVYLALVSCFIIFKKWYNKVTKIVFLSLAGLLVLFAISFFLNAQYQLTGIRNIFSSNRLFNYIYNTNRYSENARVILNGIFSKEKMIGFPLYFDYEYNLLAIPSNNVLINQFMYGGVFGFLFFIVIVALFVYVFIKIRKLPIEDKVYKYFPLVFVISYFVITFVLDQNSYDLFDYTLIFANYLSPFFYISLFIFGHYYGLSNEEVNVDEE